jgi:hypothetical protein
VTANNIVDVFSSEEPGRIKRVEIKIVGGNIRINASRRSTVAVKAKGDVETLGATATVHGHVLRIGSSSASPRGPAPVLSAFRRTGRDSACGGGRA